MKKINLMIVLVLFALLLGCEKTNEYHPIVIAYKDQQGNFSSAEVIGGSKDGKWFKVSDFKMKLNGQVVTPDDFSKNRALNGKKVQINLVQGEELLKFYSTEKFIGAAKGKQPTFVVDGYANQILTVKLTPLKTNQDLIIGVNGEWNAMPRLVKTSSEKGIYSIDIDADGTDELIRVQDKQVESLNVDGNPKQLFLEKNNQNIYITYIPIDGIYTSSCKMFLLDLNGDNILEMLIAETGHNLTVSAFQFKDDKAVKILEYYVGD